MSPSNEATLEARRAFCLSSGMMMKALPFVFLLLVSPAAAQDRFAPDNPWFRDFETSCRGAGGVVEECEGSILGAFADFAKVAQESVSCDFREFWHVRDTNFDFDEFAVLPWQNGVEAIVQTPGVCELPVEAMHEYFAGDNLLACLMAKAAVEMRHGASAETALKAIDDGCIDDNPEPGGESDWLDSVYSRAVRGLEAMEKAQVF
jgi:hypothetical protein